MGDPTLPHVVGDNIKNLADLGGEDNSVRCSESLEGQEIKVAYTAYNPFLPALYRFRKLNGNALTHVQCPDNRRAPCPTRPGPGRWRSAILSSAATISGPAPII